MTGDPSILPPIIMRPRLTESTAVPAFATSSVSESISTAAE